MSVKSWKTEDRRPKFFANAGPNSSETSVFGLPSSVFLLLLLITSCSSPTINEKPISLSSYEIEEGFELQVMASEPLLIAPMVMDFDEQGRMWVLELPGYMANIDGEGENDPTGRILILNDQNGNGRMDQSQIFLDKLVAPRAMLLAYGGLLYAEPPNLWFVEIENDKPGKKVLVDASYVLVGNIEHQANGLMMNIDNWIYSARSNARYQRKNGKWIKEQTAYRGQWGMTKDHHGRLFYNDNSNQLQGDLVLPMATLRNSYMRPKHSIRQQIATDQRMYPLHPAVINRGYVEGSLDEEGKPLKITSSCGPVIYQGDLFPEGYNGNSFVCLPEGNIVKRNIMHYEQGIITATQAWEGKEFIASTDVAFRPVNLYNGPEGALYIVDLHKGVIQHRAYMSPYLREKIEKLKLDTIIGYGRILRVVPEGATLPAVPSFDKNDIKGLVEKLNSPNVWVRDKAHQILVQNQLKAAIPLLEKLLDTKEYSIAQIHALWILKGLDALSFPLLNKAMGKENIDLRGLAFYLLENVNPGNPTQTFEFDRQTLMKIDTQLNLYLAPVAGSLIANEKAFAFYLNMSLYHGDKDLSAELALSGLAGKEELFLNFIRKRIKDVPPIWERLLEDVINNRKEDKTNKEMLPAQNNPYGDKRQKGLELYRLYCAACHGEAGGGIENLAPPLDGSDYISGSTERLALIMLHGLAGPIHINGERYTFNAAMPGIGSNPDISDKDILSIIIFLKNAFSTESTSINEERIKELREIKPPSGSLYTEDLLTGDQ